MNNKVLLLLMIFSTPAFSNVQADMQKFFTEIGGNTNVSPAGAYKGQEGGFYTGGSLFVRNPMRDIQLVNVQVPGMAMSCGAIDVFTGGIGFVDSTKIVEMMKAVGSNAAGYLFSLAAKQLSPQIMNQIEELQSWANEANWNNINSCQAASKIIDSSVGYFQESAKKNCMDKGLSAGGDDYGNYVKARHKCQNQREVNAKNREAATDEQLKDSVITNVNIVWRAIQNNPMLAALDPEIKYLLMSLTGTVVIIVDENSGALTKKVYVSKLYSDDIINNLSSSKRFKVYSCRDAANGCLEVIDREIEIPPEKTFVGQVRAILQSLEQKAILDEPLTDKEKAFLETTTLPIYKMLNVHAAFSKGVSLMFVTDYAEVIAMDILYRYLDRGISEVMQAFSNNLLPKGMDAEFCRMIVLARERVRDLRQMQMQRLNTTYELVSKVQMMEKQVSAIVSSQLYNSMNWGRGLR